MIKVAYNSCFGGFGLSAEAVKWLHDHGFDEGDRPDTRHHPLLIECIETLGKRADGRSASLCVRTIPGNRYKIDEYDGSETVRCPEDEQYWNEVAPHEIDALMQQAKQELAERMTPEQIEIQQLKAELAKMQARLSKLVG